MNNVVIIYIILSVIILISYFVLSKRKVDREINNLGLSGYSIYGVRKNNITPAFVFLITFFVYSSVGMSDKSDFSQNEILVFAVTCLLGLLSFLLGYGLDDSKLNKRLSYSKANPSLTNKKINYTEIVLIIVFLAFCLVNYQRIYEMVVHFGTARSYSDYAIREERTALTGLRSAFSNYFTLVFLALPFYRCYRDKKIHLLDLFIFVIVSAYALFSGNRTNLVLIGLLFAVLINNRFLHLRMSFILIITFFGAAFLVLAGHLRVYNNFDAMWNMVKKGNVAQLLSLNSSGEFKYTTQTTFSYIHAISSGSKFFDLGFVYVIDLVMYIPAFLFPGRPLPPQEQYMLEFFPSAISGTGHGWFILTDGYMSFGIIGVIIEMFIYGKFLKYIYKKYFENNNNPLVNFLYVYLLLYVFYSIRSSFILSIKNYLIAILPILLVIIVGRMLTGGVQNGRSRYKSINNL